MDLEGQIEQLKNASQEILDEILGSGRPISQRLQNEIDQMLDWVATRIQELRQLQTSQEDVTEGLSPVPELTRGPYPSSNINSFKYDPQSKTLFVKFMGKDSADSGPVYQYEGVPRLIFQIFRKGAVPPKTSGKNQYHRWIKGVTPSLGAAMYALIRNGPYPYARLT